VRRRETSSLLNSWAGGRLFPGISCRARFAVNESDDRLSVSLRSDDGETDIVVQGRRAAKLPSTSAFRSLDEASAFFQAGSLGYSATPDPSRFQGMELSCFRWNVEPLDIDEVRSSHFDDRSLFPPGSIEFDCALLMRDIEHEWHGKPDLRCSTSVAERRLQLSSAR
jgi:hypothetical protein